MRKSSRASLPPVLASRIGKIASAPSVATEEGVTGSSRGRRNRRRTAFREATLVLEMGERLPVIIKDYSEAGARIEFVVDSRLPPEVAILSPFVPHRRAKVIWQKRGSAGLSFEL
jgi:hypothetical protein